MAKIKVVCIQSHQTPTEAGRFDTFEVDNEYAIDESVFAPNLFRKIEEKKTKKQEVEA